MSHPPLLINESIKSKILYNKHAATEDQSDIYIYRFVASWKLSTAHFLVNRKSQIGWWKWHSQFHNSFLHQFLMLSRSWGYIHTYLLPVNVYIDILRTRKATQIMFYCIYITVYMVPSHLKIWNDVTTYLLNDNIFTTKSMKWFFFSILRIPIPTQTFSLKITIGIH